MSIDAEKLIEWLKERRETIKQEYLHKSTNKEDVLFLVGKYLAFTTVMFHVERMQKEKQSYHCRHRKTYHMMND